MFYHKEQDDQEQVEILLVDERPENLMLMEEHLVSDQFSVIKASSSDAALRYLLDHEPAIILMSVQLSNTDGFETTKLIRSNRRTRNIPIIFISSSRLTDMHIRQGYEYGVVDYLYRPLDPHILRAKVAVFVELAQKNRQLRRAERLEREQQINLLELKNLRRSQIEQRKYLDLVEGISHGIVWSADPETLAIRFVSPSAEKILGYPIEQWTSEDSFFINHTHPDDKEKVLRAFRRLKKKGKDAELNHRLIAKNGQEVWIHTGLRINHDDTHLDSHLEIRGLSVEITKIKEAEEILKLNKKHSDFLAEASLILSKSLDFEAIVPQISKLVVPKIADWFGVHLTASEASPNPSHFAHSDPSKKAIMQAIFQNAKPTCLTKAKYLPNFTDSDLRYLIRNEAHFDQLKKLMFKSAILIPLTSSNKVYGMMMLLNAESDRAFTPSEFNMAVDLSRRFTMAFDNANFFRQAQDAIKVRDEFLSVASHELKTPITPLKLQIQILMRAIESGSDISRDRIRKMLDSSDRQLERLTVLVDELLDVARINKNGTLQIKPERFDFIELIYEVLDRFAGQFLSAKCSLTTDIPAERVEVNWDRFRMEQVLINLLSNALKYGNRKPVHLSVTHAQGNVTFTVQDHGIGIDESDQKRIFERFERAVSGVHFSGLGLGLYITAQIVQSHAGLIQLESSPGEGATFRVILPKHLNHEYIRLPQPIFEHRRAHL